MVFFQKKKRFTDFHIVKAKFIHFRAILGIFFHTNNKLNLTAIKNKSH